MKRFQAIYALAFLLLAAPSCQDTDKQSGDSGPAVTDSGADTGLDTTPDRDTTEEPDDTSADTERNPTDADPSWDFGLSDTGGDQPFELTGIVPPKGPVEGGNRVRIVGEGLTEEVDVFFGSKPFEARFSDGALVGPAPPATAPGPVTVKAIDEEGTVESIADGYTYVAGVTVDEITPNEVPTEGGVQVEIRGSGFEDPTAVSVDGSSALRVERIDDGLLRAIVPPGQRGPADVRVTTSAESETVDGGITYFAPLDLTSVAPAAGPTAGGTTVTLSVEGLASQPTVNFGGREATVQSLDLQQGTVEVTAPAHAAGLVDVTLQADGDADIATDAFLYTDQSSPTVAAISPDFGPTSGGTKANLIGAGLGGSNVEVAVGGAQATVLEAKPTFIRIETPAGMAGMADVAVDVDGSEVARLTDGFEYRAVPTVDSVNPTEGTHRGGETVTITGEGFQGADRVLFGGLPAGFTVQSDTKIEATTPAHSAGKVDVTVERNGVGGTLEQAYLFTEPLEVWGFSPVRGAVAGGTYVKVRGRGFVGTIKATVGPNEASKVRRIDRNNIYLYTPPGSLGEVDLAIEAAGQTATGPYPFEYFNPASRYGGASGGQVDGAVNVTVMSRGGGPIPQAFVMLSTRADTPYTGMTDQNGQVTLSGPDVLGPQTVTATAKGHTTTTVHTVDAENVTVLLTNLNADGGGGGGGGGPPTGTIRGKVKSPRKLADPDVQKTYDMAMVQTTQKEIGNSGIEPGPNSVVVSGGEYEITSRIGDLAVVALCGIYHETDDRFEPKYIGVKRYMNISDGGTYTADIDCDIPLDQTLEVKIQNPIFAPGGPDTNLAEVYWDFGFEGVFKSPTSGRGLGKLLSVEDQPKLDGAINDVTFSVVGGSFTGENTPSSQTQAHDIPDSSKPVVLPPLVDVPEPVSPKPGGEMTNREIRFQTAGPHFPDFYSIRLLDQRGRPFWQHILPGTEQSVRIPNFPDLSYLPVDRRPDPAPSGQTYILFIGIDATNGNFDSFSYRDLSFGRWRGYSITRWGFTLPSNP